MIISCLYLRPYSLTKKLKIFDLEIEMQPQKIETISVVELNTIT